MSRKMIPVEESIADFALLLAQAGRRQRAAAPVELLHRRIGGEVGPGQAGADSGRSPR